MELRVTSVQLCGAIASASPCTVLIRHILDICEMWLVRWDNYFNLHLELGSENLDRNMWLVVTLLG